jgi:hypothetical protein
MKLIDLLDQIAELDLEDVIYAKKEWSESSEAEVFRLSEESGHPAAAAERGLEYFLEIPTIRDILKWPTLATASREQRCARIIHYALYDA